MQKKRGRKPKIPRSTQIQVFLDVLNSPSPDYSEVAETYGVKTAYVRYLYYRWRDAPPPEIAKRLSKSSEDPKDGKDARIITLEQELAYSRLKVEALEKMIELAEETFEIDIRKKSGSQQQDS